METTIKNALENKRKGFHIGNRLILPFKCQLIEIIADGNIVTEFSGSDDFKISHTSKNTSFYFTEKGALRSMIDTYKVVKVIACEEDSDISIPENHIKLVCEIDSDHVVLIYEPSEDMLFIE
ncbi:MAG TPA: hypothetical protein EYQ86_08900 [Bacteroidetes bacterium]|nr:hypothetical protein [Bacteroidota bacterium]